MNVQGQIEIKTFPFTWKINNFSDLMSEKGEVRIQSPIFEVSDGMKKSLWQIILLIPEKDDSYIDLYLLYLHDNTYFQNDNYCFTFSLLDNVGKKVVTRVSNVHKFESIKMWGRQIILKNEITNNKYSLLVENILSVVCEITMNVYSTEEVRLKDNSANIYETFYLNEKFSDVTIIVDQEKIKAHKIVLSTKSKVFAAVLERNMKENNKDIIEINDISLDVMKELLLFIYCGRVNNLTKIAKPLLEAADKYDLSLLRVKCEESMFKNLNTVNACETLVASDLHNCQKLKSETIDFIIKNLTEVTETNEFAELKHWNPKLLEEILHRIAQQQKMENPIIQLY